MRVAYARTCTVRRAKLYYLRGRTGKAARIREQTTGHSGKLEAAIKEEAAQVKRDKDAKACVFRGPPRSAPPRRYTGGPARPVVASGLATPICLSYPFPSPPSTHGAAVLS